MFFYKVIDTDIHIFYSKINAIDMTKLTKKFLAKETIYVEELKNRFCLKIYKLVWQFE